MADLLDTMLAELSELTQTVADLEQQQESIRLKLANLRALQVELLGTADVLNRKRHHAEVMVPVGRFVRWSPLHGDSTAAFASRTRDVAGCPF